MINVCSVSGGKDSTALYCLMVEYHGKDFLPVFADTGHEHPVTYNYVRNLHLMANGPKVQFVKGDFSKKLKAKGITPTENSFLDMMLWKGRAPSTKAQFCTEHLKLWPILFYLLKVDPTRSWLMHTGIRAGESKRRSKMQPFAWNNFFDCMTILPLINETEDFIFKYLESKGVPPNPLYALGFNRVGCFPCIHANKSELSNLPDWAWEILEYYESKIGRTWFPYNLVPGVEKTTIPIVREWCKTTYGGRNYDLFKQGKIEDAPSCMTGWINCE